MKLKYAEPLSNFASNFNLRRYIKAILASVAYLNEQVDPELIAKNETVPLLEISLELVAPEIQWQPEIGQSSGRSAGAYTRPIFSST